MPISVKPQTFRPKNKGNDLQSISVVGVCAKSLNFFNFRDHFSSLFNSCLSYMLFYSIQNFSNYMEEHGTIQMAVCRVLLCVNIHDLLLFRGDGCASLDTHQSDMRQ